VWHKVHYQEDVSNTEKFANVENAYNSHFGVEMNKPKTTVTLEEDPEQEYHVQDIIDEEIDEQGVKWYRVRWLGYDETHDTLEKYEEISHTDAFKRWEDPTGEVQALSLKINDEDYPSLSVAMHRADRELWIDAMGDEYNALMAQETWEVVPRPLDRKTISVKWVLRIKWNTDRTVPLYKARLCARGFTQVKNIDYEETYSPTLSKTGLRLIFAVAVQQGMLIHTVDCKNAFLNGFIDKEIYLEQPPQFVKEGTTTKSHVCKLRKALYGLKQAPLIWCHTLRDALNAAGFEQLTYEPCIFVKRSNEKNSNKRKRDLAGSWEEFSNREETCILGVYVDDITIMAKSLSTIEKAKSIIKDAFKIKDEGEITKVIGMEFTKIDTGYIIHQKSKLLDILARQGMSECNGNRVPMETNAVSEMTESRTDLEAVDNHWYRSIVGELLYISVCSRPDLSFAVNMCARQVENPNSRHKGAVIKILRYIKSTTDFGLIYQGSGKEPRLVVHSDSDFAADKKDSKSTTGFVVTMNGCTISWYSSKQKAVSTSTVEAEYIAASAATKEVIWLQYLLTELTGCMSLQPPLLLLDSTGAETLAQNDGISNKTKHIRYSYHFIRDAHANKLIEIRHIAGAENPADMLTKPLAFDKFSKFRGKINVDSFSNAKCRKSFTSRGFLKQE
jgi:histone deacetylase 1/2